MSAICRFTAVVTLLAHLIFGCSLHHAAACHAHVTDRGEHRCYAWSTATVDAEHDCHREHSAEHQGQAQNTEQVQSSATCSSCGPQPRDGDHPECCSGVECTFAPSRDFALVIDIPFVAFVTFAHDPMLVHLTLLSSQAVREGALIGAVDSLSLCASLCTWLI